jgi:formylglycine-generating enzyme required for sulfatase activity
LDINRLWRDIMARQSPSLNNTTIDLGPRAEDLRATAASDYRSLLLAQAHAMGHERLLKALERSFPLSFEFARHTSGLEIQLTPVTQAQIMVWRLIGGVPDEETLPEFRDEQDSEGDHIDLGDGISINYNHPAERISAPEALAFVAWLNALTDRDQCRYTLLTAHQYDELLLWEDVRGARDIRRFAHVESVSTCSVQRYEPWGHGLRHLVGNVETWLLSGPDGAVCGSRGGEFSSDPQVLKDLPLEEQDLEGRYQGVGLRLARVCL